MATPLKRQVATKIPGSPESKHLAISLIQPGKSQKSALVHEHYERGSFQNAQKEEEKENRRKLNERNRRRTANNVQRVHGICVENLLGNLP